MVKAASLLALPFVLAWGLDLCCCGVFAVELRCHVIMLQRIYMAFLVAGACTAKGCKELMRGNLCKSGACSFLADGSRASATWSIFCILREAAKGEVAFCGIRFSAFAHLHE